MTMLASIHKHAHGVLKGISREQREIRFVATRLEVDRDGEVVVPSGMDTANYDKNPTVLLQHDPLSPIGRVVSLRLGLVDGVPGWIGIARIDPPGTSEAADRAYRQIASGSLNGVSIGFMVQEVSPRALLPGQTGRTYTKTSLLEISLVTIPSCASCVILEKTLRKETAMHDCTCQGMDIDWHAINAQMSNTTEVDVSEADVRRVIRHLMPALKAGMLAGLQVQAKFAVDDLFRRMTGRLN
ncbi:MAG: HK97 family phage prohead protease [Nitrospira sp.]|nr:HK97 family phage prohead protease [Nitrospira sp.]